MTGTWIVTADRTGARILEKTDEGPRLIRTLTHDEGRLREVDLGTDRPGRSFDRAGAGRRHAMGSPVTLHEQTAITFATEIADYLRHGRVEGRFTRLMLVAEPHFLGLLRGALDALTAHLVVQSIAKDLQHVPPTELAEHLRDGPIHGPHG